jgi:exo-1,4-beta-D-glucosaminidase
MKPRVTAGPHGETRISTMNERVVRDMGSAFAYSALLLAACAVLASPAQVRTEGTRGTHVELASRWTLQSSCLANATGEQISKSGFSAAGWHHTVVPSTVVAALVADGTYPNPYVADNLRKIPGTTYPIGGNFSNLPMPRDSPFACSWWYRTSFEAAPEDGERVWLRFGGINNHANIWLNGQEIANTKAIAGAYRTYEFDVTPYLVGHGENVVAIETVAQTEKDLGINWVDWNPAPPDKDMGLWRGVSLETTGPVAVRYPEVITHLPDSSLKLAELTVGAELHNALDKPVTGTVEASLEGFRVRQEISLNPLEVREIRFTPDQFPELRVRDPQLWWPRQMGEPNLRTLSVRFLTGRQLSDSATVRYGIREIVSQLDSDNHRVFLINGKRLLIRGGGWCPDMLLRQDLNRVETQFRYVRDMNLNTIRLEGKLETDEFYDLADQQGVLIMAGWCCCDHWERWKRWQPGDLAIATASLHSQIMRMRSHPSMLVWLNGSDNPPPVDVEKAYIQVLKDSDWPNPYLSSASQRPTSVTGPSGVKMTGPYDYIPPDYWLSDPGKQGGAWGFNTETGPGPAVPPVISLEKMLDSEDVKPDTLLWNYHAGSEGFKDLSHFESAMDAIYGSPSNFADYELKAQAMAYDGERAMFEAYSGRKYKATGVIQWMLDNAWPSLIWHLYDYYLQPAGGYFGTKKACEPLHVQYAYDDHSIEVVNSRYDGAPSLTVAAKLYDVNLEEKFSRQASVHLDADQAAKVFALPDDVISSSSPVYFLDLALNDAKGRTVSTNFYWLSPKKNTYEWGKTSYRFTPVSSYEDLKALETLPKAGAMNVSATVQTHGDGPAVRVRIKNPSQHLAFQVHLGIAPPGEQKEILPVLWQDNYIELMPGESREITAQFVSPDALKGGAQLVVSGWNIDTSTVALRRDEAMATPLDRGFDPGSRGN